MKNCCSNCRWFDPRDQDVVERVAGHAISDDGGRCCASPPLSGGFELFPYVCASSYCSVFNEKTQHRIPRDE